MRAGAHALSLLSVPLNVHVITALEEEPLPLMELRRQTGSPPQTTMRSQMKALTEIGILERHRTRDFPGSVEFGLTRRGRELLSVAEATDRWLASAPDGPHELGSITARGQLKALIDGWSSSLVRALAARPLALTQLDRLISGYNYPSLERRLGAMRLTGQIRPCRDGGRSTPYAVTDWLRQAVAPLISSAHWEHKNMLGDTAVPITRLDMEAAFLLSVPLLKLDADTSGNCRLAVEMTRGADAEVAGVLVSVKNGLVISCVSRLQGRAAAWASGSPMMWLSSVIGTEPNRLELGGECDLARAIVDGLQAGLFAVPQMSQ